MKCAHIFALTLVLFVLPEDVFCVDAEVFSTEVLAEGRTFVHNTVKRLALILPAVFFKLGIAFSLLLLVTIVAVNNGFIGFLLLIVGVSSVLARLQEARRVLPIPVPALHAPLPLALGHHHHFLDRSDDVSGVKEVKSGPTANTPYSGYGTIATNPSYTYANSENIYNGGKYYSTR